MRSVILVFLVLLATNANALSWSQMKSWMNKTIDPDVKYNIETEGYNVRVYEFTPLTDPGATCIMTFTNEKMGMYCFPKTEHALKNPNK